MMRVHGYIICMVSLMTITSAFQIATFGSRLSSRSAQLRMSEVSDLSEEVDYKSLVVSGFVSKENNFAETFSLSKLFKTGKWSDITTVTDDLKFARKRIVSPDSVYSGLMDILKFAVVDCPDQSSSLCLLYPLIYSCLIVELTARARVSRLIGSLSQSRARPAR